MRSNNLPPALIANLQNVLIGRKTEREEDTGTRPDEPQASGDASETREEPRPVVLVTNAGGIGSPGLAALVECLVREGRYDVYVCAPELDKSLSAHSITVRETLVASSVEVAGVKAFELSGTPVDCVSLALSGALFSWSKPILVISGINRGLCCGQDIFYSGAIAGAREALMRGVPSLSISLDWKEKSEERHFTDAANVCLPLIVTAIADIEKGVFPSNCFMRIDIPTFPMDSKGFKVTKSSQCRSLLNWEAVSGNKPPSASQYMSRHQSLGIQLAQLGRDASAAGAARRITTQSKTVEIESVASTGKFESQSGMLKKYFRLELVNKEQEDLDDDFEYKAVKNGLVAITPLCLPFHVESDEYTLATAWIRSAVSKCKATEMA